MKARTGRGPPGRALATRAHAADRPRALSSLRPTLLALAIASLAGLATAQTPHAQEPETGRENRAQDPGRRPPGVPREQIAGGRWPILDWQQATGDWGGFRAWLNERGVDPEVFLTSDASWVASGGADRGGTALRALFDATVTIDGGKLLGVEGARLFADFQVQGGSDGTVDVGDLQGYSNIDGPHRVQLAKVWYEQVLLDRALRFKIGKVDANTDFAYVEHGFRFLNSSFGFSPTVLGFPTYPDPAFGALAFVRPGGGVYLGAGVFDGATQAGVATGPRGPRTLFDDPAGLFAIGEAGLRWRGGERALRGRVGAGVWRHTGRFGRFDGGTDGDADGFYLVADQKLWRPEPEGERGLGCSFQYGWADPMVSPIEHHVGVGLEWAGPSERRPDDACGVGVTWGAFSDEPAAGLRGAGELTVELFYSLPLTPWLRLKPDVQYIHAPGGTAGLDDALVFTLRSSITL